MRTSRYLRDERRAELEELGEAVAEEHCPNGRIDPIEVAKRVGITVSCNDYADAFLGLLEHRAGAFHIYCNIGGATNGVETPRVRFTLGHELAHFFIDEHRHALSQGAAPRHGSVSDYATNNLAEREADTFASALLMPSGRFLDACRGRTPGFATICDVADRFGTSRTSTAIKYVRLDIAPCAVVKWNPDGFAWKWLSASAYAARFRSIQMDPRKLIPGSPTRRALDGEANPECGYFESGTTGAYWFPWLAHGDSRSAIFVEQALRLGSHGVVTLLYPDSGSF